MRVIAALGGNALLQRGDPPDAEVQLRHVREAARALAPLAAQHELVLCHGNGPQVGMLALESEADDALARPYPLDALVAQTQGLIGYWIAQELRNAGVARPIVTVVTQTVVREDDPAFLAPTKFIGPRYSPHHARRLAAKHGWSIAAEGGYQRRVVPSPEPQRFLELPAIRTLVDSGIVAICAGGGGAPVSENESGQFRGIEAVVDKDLVAALLARDLAADALLLLTDVPAVMRDFGTDHEAQIRDLDIATVRAMDLPAGSMGPKVEACARFAASGGLAVIGALADAQLMLTGDAGTRIRAVVPMPAGSFGPGRSSADPPRQ